ncbi:MAG: adenylate/guanylate cyclase domain-containing protein [Gaiellaceae bacterium]
MRALPSGTVTFLFTDVERSTALLHELGAEACAEVLAEHRRVLREAFAAHAGVEVDTQGDALFVAFGLVKDALAAATAGQAALAEGPVRVRVGIHTGEPLVSEDGYVGVDVHRAARIMAAGHGGQVLVSETAVLPAVARALEVQEVPGEPLEATLRSFLASRRLLLLLDNFEHLLDARSLLAGLLAGCPQLCLLVTSRSTLSLTSEHVYEVPPLREDEAVDLFVERAQQAGAAVVADATLAAVCNRLDRLPLAIELAAARARLLEPQACSSGSSGACRCSRATRPTSPRANRPCTPRSPGATTSSTTRNARSSGG